MNLHGGEPAGQACLRWLTDQAWPLWLEHGVDWQRSAFHEHLDPASLRCAASFRRLRVAARQTYVFSKAARYHIPHAKEAVALGLDFLQGPARLPDGGFAWRFDLDNQQIDPTLDLYDHAFVLLAFSGHGVNRSSGLVVNRLWSDGTVSDGGFRLWPQTERLKAVALRRPDRVPAAFDALKRHFAGARPGLWIERIDASGRAIAEPAPATSLYHLTAAFTDDAVLRQNGECDGIEA
jgi:mannose/cellobiose epimerase-like protein (N-acyl-D-glucosamine 2-epimerase family)